MLPSTMTSYIFKYSLQDAALLRSGFILFEMDLHDKVIVVQLSALFEELIEKLSEKAVKPRKANKKVNKQKSLKSIKLVLGC